MQNVFTLFENFTTLKWVKWSKRKPEFNGNAIVNAVTGKTADF